MRVKSFLVAVLMIGLFQAHLFPLITSKIQGTVVDKDTGQPIEGAWVNLFNCTGMRGLFNGFCIPTGEVQTDKFGKFFYSDLEYGPYFLVIVHPDYICFGPVNEVRKYLGRHTRYEIEGEPMRGLRPEPFFKNEPQRNFTLLEGEIKHFNIQLEKAAKLEITAKIKRPSGIDVYKGEVSLWISDVDNKSIFWSGSFKDGYYAPKFLPGIGKVLLTYRVDEYPSQKREITLNKGQIEKVDILFDYTQGQGVHVVLKDKITKRGIYNADVFLLENVPEGQVGDYAEARTDYSGEFWIGGLKLGSYFLRISHISYATLYEKEITIKKNEMVELSIEF